MHCVRMVQLNLFLFYLKCILSRTKFVGTAIRQCKYRISRGYNVYGDLFSFHLPCHLNLSHSASGKLWSDDNMGALGCTASGWYSPASSLSCCRYFTANILSVPVTVLNLFLFYLKCILSRTKFVGTTIIRLAVWVSFIIVIF